MQQFLYRCWFDKHPLRWLFLPLSALFFCLSALRRKLYEIGLLKSYHPAVPVLVVGNLSVGGNGKTPVVLLVVKWLVELGYIPGVLSRGYGGQCEHFPHLVTQSDPAQFVGDEPRLIANRGLCKVVIDPIRSRGADFLASLGCNIIVCDDGLQHYALQRDIEWLVMDDRKLGNGWLLPMGPLRELPSRLKDVDAVIHNGNDPLNDDTFTMSLRFTRFVNVRYPQKTLSINEFLAHYQDKTLHAVAGIGSPQRFFQSLTDLGFVDYKTTALADHHHFTSSDLPDCVTLMTEKDAVKCQSLAHDECWYLQVDAILSEQLKSQLEVTLKALARATIESKQ